MEPRYITIAPSARIGHVHLKAADLERSLGFYRDTLGFDVIQQIGSSTAFLSAGGCRHHLALNTCRAAFAAALQRLPPLCSG